MEQIVAEEVKFVRHARAKRYIVRVDSQGKIVLTLPLRGSKRFALGVANEHRQWVRERQASVAAENKAASVGLRFGDRILFRGQDCRLELERDCGRPVLRFGGYRVFIADENMDLRRPLRSFGIALAKEEFPTRLRKLAAFHGLSVKRVSVREQKTRWGSCSSSGTISLNWRLVLAPEEVMEYVMIHELMHMWEMNHSARFWALVESACPDYREFENWLHEHQERLNW